MALPMWAWWALGAAGYVGAGAIALYVLRRLDLLSDREDTDSLIFWAWPLAIFVALFVNGAPLEVISEKATKDRKAAEERRLAKGRYAPGVPVVEGEEGGERGCNQPSQT